jgi:hypothetical protein
VLEVESVMALNLPAVGGEPAVLREHDHQTRILWVYTGRTGKMKTKRSSDTIFFLLISRNIKIQFGNERLQESIKKCSWTTIYSGNFIMGLHF